jgi:tRNA G18 (ribose-2'-O)-methylase SpoU
MKLNAKQLRVTPPAEGELERTERRPIRLVLDNVLDTYNIGGLFRLAEAVAAAELILCGGSETPPSSRIHKAAVGTEKWVPWRYFPSAEEAVKQLRTEIAGLKVIAIEQDSRAEKLEEAAKLARAGNPIAIVVGHETDGVSKEVLDMADMIAEIPMWGVNKSLNVIVSAAIAVYGIQKSD